MAPAPFPPPSPEELSFLKDFQDSILWGLGGFAAAVFWIGRAVSGWVKRNENRYEGRFHSVETRVAELETRDREREKELIALRSLDREVASQGRRLDEQGHKIDEGFASVTKMLLELASQRSG